MRNIVILCLLASLLAACGKSARDTAPRKPDPCAALDVTDGAWHRAMFVLSGDTAFMYCDGSKVAEKSRIVSSVNTPTELLIGADFDQWRDSVWGRFVGVIDEVRISDRHRKPSNAPLEPDEHTIALWHFDETAGDTVFDGSSNGLDGYVYRCKRTPDGLRGGAIEFTGAGYIVVPDNDLLTTSTLCVEIAFKTSKKHDAGQPSPVLISKYVNCFPGISEYCAFIGGENGRGLVWTSNGQKLCGCPPYRPQE